MTTNNQYLEYLYMQTKFLMLTRNNLPWSSSSACREVEMLFLFVGFAIK